MRKAQAEVVIILALFVVIVVVVATQWKTLTSPETEDTRNARIVVEDFIKSGLSSVANDILSYGGYSSPDDFEIGSVMLDGKEAPYWQYGGRVVIPDVNENIKTGLQKYLSEHKDGFFKAANSEGIISSLGDPVVNSVRIVNNRIEASVTMPTTAKEQPVSQPYEVSIPSRLGEMLEFSRSFVTDSVQSRPLEHFTLTSMAASPMDEGAGEIPFFISLDECGDSYIRTWYDLKPKMEKTIERTLSNIYMPGKVPLNTLSFSSSPKFSLVRYNGKDYADLDVDFFPPDDFELDFSSFQFSPNPIISYAKPIPFMSECYSDPVYVRYYLNYPAVVKVRDPESGESLRFAVQVYIINNTPADLSGNLGVESSLQAEICSSMQCSASISLTDSSGNPVPDAKISFMGCPVGETSSSGKFDGDIPCGIGPLQIYKKGFEMFSELYSSSELEDADVTIRATPVIYLNFYEVNVANNPISNSYTIQENEIYALNEQTAGEIVYASFFNPDTNKTYQTVFNSLSGRITNIPEGNYIVYLSLSRSTENGAEERGAVYTPLSITKELDGKELYVYLPNSPSYRNLATNEEKTQEAIRLNNVLSRCGLGPISDSPASLENGCFVSYDEVLS